MGLCMRGGKVRDLRNGVMIQRRFRRLTKMPLGIVLTLSAFTMEPTVFAHERLLFIDSPEVFDAGADGSDALEIAPVESPLPEQELVSTRLFGIIPNYRASDNLEDYKPLTRAEKYHIAFQDSFDWPNFFLLAVTLPSRRLRPGGFSITAA